KKDTLKLMEATSGCLKNEMSRYFSASNLSNRKVLTVQCINNMMTLICTKQVE
ncbi:hypothetical protein K501DRAFT_192517, partial [Backusella circina FSU 941]